MIASMDDDDRTKMKKIDLIQQATTRLRRKQLEEQLSDMMAGLRNIQTQSKYLHDQLSGTMATTQQLTDYDLEQQHEQMDLLENQAKLHQAILQQWFPFMSSSTTDFDIPMGINDDSSIISSNNINSGCNGMNDTKKTTMSRLSSLSMISSLFSRPISRSTSISEFTDMDSESNVNGMGGHDSGTFSGMEQQWNQLHRYQRRLRIKNHRQKHQHRQRISGDNEDRDNVLADLAMASTAFSSPSKKRNEHGNHQSIASLPSTDPTQRSPTTSPVALSLKPVHPHQLEVTSTIPLPSPPLSPMSFSCTCRSPSSQEKGYHHDNEDTLSISSYSRYEFISDDGKSDTSDDAHYQHLHYHQKTSSPSSVSVHYPLSSSSDETSDRHPQYSSDTAFDDTMAILDQMDAMAKDGYDEHFFQDMAFLLDHPDICSQPLSNLAPLLEQQHQLEQALSDDDMDDRRVTSPSGWAHGPSSVSSTTTTSPYIQHLCSSGWQWYRFVSILSASYVVSLLKGPDDLLED